MNENIPPPTPRPAIADKGLSRPNRATEGARDRGRLWLDKNENADPALADVVRNVAATLPASAFYGYPDLGPLYRKLASFTGVAPEKLLLSTGSDGAIRAAFEAFVEPGDTVILTSPTFAMYPVYCKIYGARARPIAYAPSAGGPKLDAETLIAAIGETAPRLVCLPNPDSPTGTIFAQDELRAIIEAAGSAGAVMLIDEAYYPFHRETAISWIDDYSHLIVTRSTGKAWGLAGLRIGYAAAAEELNLLLHKVRPMYEVSTLAAAIFDGMLDHGEAMMESVRRLEAGKALFLAEMNAMGLQTISGFGNFCHVAFAGRAEKVHAALKNHVYYRQDFNEPCLKGFSRFSSAPPEKIQPVVELIKTAAESRPRKAPRR